MGEREHGVARRQMEADARRSRAGQMARTDKRTSVPLDPSARRDAVRLLPTGNVFLADAFHPGTRLIQEQLARGASAREERLRAAVTYVASLPSGAPTSRHFRAAPHGRAGVGVAASGEGGSTTSPATAGRSRARHRCPTGETPLRRPSPKVCRPSGEPSSMFVLRAISSLKQTVPGAPPCCRAPLPMRRL